jgi:hypothetical protein
MEILAQFLLRLTFGLALGMAITSPHKVPSGFFRNHLYVTLGLSTFAALVSYAAAPEAFWYAIAAAVASYVGSVCWLYEKKNFGKSALLFVALVSFAGINELLPRAFDRLDDRRYFSVATDMTAEEANALASRAERMGLTSGILFLAANLSSGLLLGTTLAALFLGHWYLNSPTMEIAPLRRLLIAMAAALALQIVLSAVGLVCELNFGGEISLHWLLFVVLRWSFGLVGVGALAWMSWQMLKIPNTQSATGTLYVAVIGVFVGELTSALLSAESTFPL